MKNCQKSAYMFYKTGLFLTTSSAEIFSSLVRSAVIFILLPETFNITDKIGVIF